MSGGELDTNLRSFTLLSELSCATSVVNDYLYTVAKVPTGEQVHTQETLNEISYPPLRT